MIKKILICRPDNIGDVILFSGALKHIRKLHPHAHITLAVQAHIINLVELCPFVNTVISIDELAYWRKLQRMGVLGAHRFQSQIKKTETLIRRKFNLIKKYDWIIYPVKSPTIIDLSILANIKSKRLTGIVGCNVNMPTKADFKPENIYSDYLDVTNEDPWRHELYTTLDFLKYLGADVDSITQIQPEFWLSDADKNFMNNLGFKKPIIGLFPGASNDIRRWNVSNYRKLAKLIPEIFSFVIFGGPHDITIANKVEESLRSAKDDVQILNIAGKTTLRQLYAAISACSVLISMDTSALHMGITAGIPTIGIVGGGHFGRFVPWGNPQKNVIMTNKLDCFHCNWQCMKDNIECIDGVSADTVANVLKDISCPKTDLT